MKRLCVVLLTALVLGLFSCDDARRASQAEGVIVDSLTNAALHDTLEVIEKAEKQMVYGIEFTDSMHLEQGRFPKNKTLGSVLSEYGVSAQSIHSLAENASKVFNVKKIRSGNPYCVIFTGDSVKCGKYFIYESTPTESIVFCLTDSLKVWEHKKNVTVKEKVVKGEISSSLWNAMADANAPTALAFELSEIYAWNIDFFGLQKGDKFEVRYTETWVDTLFVGVDSIRFAIFTHCGKDFHAVPFEQNGRLDFYDYDGNSLRKAFLKAPLKFSRISSHFSHSRLHPVLKIRRPHHGVDYAAPAGTPVMTIGDGKVISKGFHKGGGHTVKIQHNSTYSTAYLHLSKYAKGLAVGSYVKQVEVIGYVGSTGLSTGPHLDFRVYKNGNPINPLKLESPSVEPVSEANKGAFEAVRDSLMKTLR